MQKGPGQVCRLASTTRAASCPLADPTSGHISQTQAKLNFIFLKKLQFQDKVQRPETVAIPATNLPMDLCQVTLPHCSSAPSPAEQHDKWPLTWGWCQELFPSPQGTDARNQAQKLEIKHFTRVLQQRLVKHLWFLWIFFFSAFILSSTLHVTI